MKTPSYYYAHGVRIQIQPVTDRVAIDLARAGPPDSPTGKWAAGYRGGVLLRGEFRLVDRSDIPDEIFEKLEARAAIHPIYQYEGTQLVVLPEVRVEPEAQGEARVRAFVAKGPMEATIEVGKYGQLILHPVSGKGADAITLANALYESLHLRMSQAHFLRITSHPDSSRKRSVTRQN